MPVVSMELQILGVVGPGLGGVMRPKGVPTTHPCHQLTFTSQSDSMPSRLGWAGHHHRGVAGHPLPSPPHHTLFVNCHLGGSLWLADSSGLLPLELSGHLGEMAINS